MHRISLLVVIIAAFSSGSQAQQPKGAATERMFLPSDTFFMLFGEPRFLFGENVPRNLYTWSPDAIGVEHSWGAAIYLGRGFEMRVTQHFLFDRFGARDRNLGAADLGPNGPWGRYNAIGVRKYFGTRRW